MSKRCGWIAGVIVVLSLGVVVQGALAQNQPPAAAARPAAGPTIALLDIAYIFKNHSRFNGMIEEIQADLKRFQAETTAERNAISQLNERLQQYHRGTPEYKSLEEEITKRQAGLAARVELQKKEFVRREMKVWCNAYKEICDATDYYVQQHGIDMVVRFNGEPADPEQPDSVGAFLSRQVISYRSNLDITGAILQMLNRPGPNRAASVQPPGARR